MYGGGGAVFGIILLSGVFFIFINCVLFLITYFLYKLKSSLSKYISLFSFFISIIFNLFLLISTIQTTSSRSAISLVIIILFLINLYIFFKTYKAVEPFFTTNKARKFINGKKCPSCSRINVPGAIFCKTCGTSIESVSVVPYKNIHDNE